MVQVLVLILLFYQRYISLDQGLLGRIIPHRGPICRFEPSCSAYMIKCLQYYGVLKGGWMGVKRIGRCHPWGSFGPDPVPKPERANT